LSKVHRISRFSAYLHFSIKLRNSGLASLEGQGETGQDRKAGGLDSYQDLAVKFIMAAA